MCNRTMSTLKSLIASSSQLQLQLKQASKLWSKIRVIQGQMRRRVETVLAFIRVLANLLTLQRLKEINFTVFSSKLLHFSELAQIIHGMQNSIFLFFYIYILLTWPQNYIILLCIYCILPYKFDYKVRKTDEQNKSSLK